MTMWFLLALACMWALGVFLLFCLYIATGALRHGWADALIGALLLAPIAGLAGWVPLAAVLGEFDRYSCEVTL